MHDVGPNKARSLRFPVAQTMRYSILFSVDDFVSDCQPRIWFGTLEVNVLRMHATMVDSAMLLMRSGQQSGRRSEISSLPSLEGLHSLAEAIRVVLWYSRGIPQYEIVQTA
jgi:hypothetical protein